MKVIHNKVILLILFNLIYSQVDYNSEVQPIFDAKCTSCHGSIAGLNLSSYTNLMNGSDNGAIVDPYNHTSSELWIRVNSGSMPPGTNDLNSTELNLVAQWINEGALEQPISGCTDSEAYNCNNDDISSNYIFDIGGIMYDNSCNWDWDTNNNQAVYVGECETTGPCDGYYNPGASTDDGSCRYYQAPNGSEIVFTQENNGISIDWSAFTPPSNAILVSYHVQRCLETSCTWINGFTTSDINTSTSVFDEFSFEAGIQIKYAIAVKYANNPYWGWAIGANYFTTCNALGDINGDNGFNVLDIVTLANCVLAQNCSTLDSACAGDINGDGGYNVLDIVTLANCVLAQNCGGRINDASTSSLIKTDHSMSIEADGFIGGVEMTLSHGSDFSIDMTDRALFADYLTSGNETRLLVISPEASELFSFEGDFEIVDVIIANSQYEVSVEMPIAASFTLSEAYPNPFNPTTTMKLFMPAAGDMQVEVYNMLGQSVATLTSGYQDAGTYNLTWDATEVASGMYFVKAEANGFTQIQKLMLVK